MHMGWFCEVIGAGRFKGAAKASYQSLFHAKPGGSLGTWPRFEITQIYFVGRAKRLGAYPCVGIQAKSCFGINRTDTFERHGINSLSEGLRSQNAMCQLYPNLYRIFANES